MIEGKSWQEERTRSASSKQKAVKKISMIGIITNCMLLILKFGVGIFSHSQAMIADAFHSVEDMFSSIVSYVAIRISSKDRDSAHPYGYGKAEYVFSLCISIFMIIASITMIRSSMESLLSHQMVMVNPWLITICIITIFVKMMLYTYARYHYQKTNNILIKASMEDHRNDMFVTSSVLLGGILSYVGFNMVDSIIGIGISIWIGVVGVKIFRDAYAVLIDTNMSVEKIENIKNKISEFDEVNQIDSIIGKPIGDKYIIIVKLEMDQEMNVVSSHTIQTRIKHKLLSLFDEIQDVIIHVNPYQNT